MLSQNIVQLANLPRLCMSFLRLGPEFIREPDDDLLLKFYSSFNWALKLAQEQKRYKGKHQGVIEKQHNTTCNLGAYINTRKSGDGIANMSAFHYPNSQ